MEIAFEHQVTGIILQRTSTDNTKPKVAESEIIGTNHLGFAKSLFQQYSQQLGLNNNHYPAESAFNFYVNEIITNFLGRPVDIASARENFYSELIQHTNLPRNHSFAPIIREINQEIERYTQRTFPITYQDKGKGKLQTPAKQRIESLIYPSYHHMPGSTINIASTDAFTSTRMLLARIAFQSKQKKNKLLGAYSDYFEGFKSRSPTPSGFRSLLHQPDFGTVTTLENSKIKTPNHQRQNNPNPELINQQNLPLPPQPPNLDPMAYVPIAKLDNFTGEKNDTQVWLNDIEKAIAANGWNDAQAMQAILYFLKDTADLWYQSLVNKPQDFNVFKVEFLRYFSNNNNINRLVNTFTTMKQKETEAVTTYLECFHQNLHQIQAIDANYFTAPQILNQFICGLCSSILQHTPPQNLPASRVQRLRITQQNWRSLMVVHQPIPSSFSKTESCQWNSGARNPQNLNSQNYLSLLVTPKDTSPSNQKPIQKQQTCTSNIPPTTVTNNKSLDAIFPFKLEELSIMPLFSRATLEEKPITVMDTDVKIDGHHIKLILDSGLADSIIT
ncbi:hypothetical protein G9A89_000078 [Geosiphon pyriformis]|nr:hypothetical protein G9A89_000078 [Geosiphon pyriformis]